MCLYISQTLLQLEVPTWQPSGQWHMFWLSIAVQKNHPQTWWLNTATVIYFLYDLNVGRAHLGSSGISRGSSDGAGGSISKMVHSHGWQVGAGCGLRASVPLHMGFPMGWIGFPHGMVAWYRERGFQELGNRSCHFLKASTWKLAQHHFCRTLLPKQPLSLSIFKARTQRFYPSPRRVAKNSWISLTYQYM